MLLNYILTAFLAHTVSVFAQVGPQATKLPDCILTCDPAAIESVNCTNADQECHCVRQVGILANITPCADRVCKNPSQSLYTFTTLFGEVCSKFNISVPVVGSNASANGTLVPLSTNTTTNVSTTSTPSAPATYTNAAFAVAANGALAVVAIGMGALFACGL